MDKKIEQPLAKAHHENQQENSFNDNKKAGQMS
jgi:hypothetical protein